MEDVYEELGEPKYSKIFHRIYRSPVPRNPRHPYEYTNPYRKLEFAVTQYFPADADIDPITIRKKEYVFLCLLRVEGTSEEYSEEGKSDEEDFDDEDIEESQWEEEYSDEDEMSGTYSDVETYSSEGSNQGDIIPFYVSKAYGTHRGIHAHRFLFFLAREESDDTKIMLAGESATAYMRPDFNVELHYLKLRERYQPSTF